MARSYEERIRFANDEILGKGNLVAVDEVFATTYVVHWGGSGGKEFKGHAFIRRFVKGLRKSIPDLRVVEVKILLKKGDTIAWQRTFRGTHKVAMKGIPPSGKKVKWSDMMVTRFEDGKIAEEWTASELAGALMLKL
ncbi:MAG: ester cyclase [Planctomycetota bacterium]|nr:ester cyclase [Planctomycetota bacterium]